MYKFEEKSRVCFLGASIITNGHMIRRIYEHYRKSGIKLEIYNCGIPGDTAQNGFSRIHDTVFCYNPTDIVVSFGMNDIKYFLYDGRDADDTVILERRRAIDTNIVYMRSIAEECQKRGIKLTFLTTNPYDEISEGGPCFAGAAAALREISERLKLMSADFGGHIIDGYTDFEKVIKKLYKEDIKIVGEDRIHPLKTGQELLSQIFLKGQGFDVDITDNYDKLKAASEAPFDEWEEKRFKLEKEAKCTEFAEWIVCRGIKDEKIIRNIIEDKMKNEENQSIINLSRDYLTKKEGIDKVKEALIQHTKTIYNSAAE